MQNKKRYILGLIIAIIVIVSLGTFAWLSYRTNDTAMVLTVGDINNVKITLNPYQIDTKISPNLTYTGQPYTTVEVINNSSSPKNIKLFYTINAIDSELVTTNLKYTIEKQAVGESSYTHITPDGNFSGASQGSVITIIDEPVPVGTTYYKVYVWLYSASSAQNNTIGKRFNAELNANILGDNISNNIYTVNIFDVNVQGYNGVRIRRIVPNNITTYNTPEAAMAALKTAGGGTTDYPFYLKHTLGTFSGWCIIMNGDTTNCISNRSSESECNTALSNYDEGNGNTYTCSNITVNNAVIESYVGFVVTPAMATANSGMTAGTYYLKGGDNSMSSLDNAKTTYDAFGGVGCSLDGNLGGNPYNTTPSSNFYCNVPGLYVEVNPEGFTYAGDGLGSNCMAYVSGLTGCTLAAS